ncbi:MAG TPA: DUF3795 domain-containing protein [Candidatus Sabulitectum sp.]|nr:DUF3795 domain-containing protein [Candidatus Sabulitectum sp.]HPF31591.1 DUF3795 domain-containing protein [Candidatus Sabulitectum sp.]HPJ28604.1 DUF3795 domain-containing protein [Candidatus Sabulitectum sp.]HPR22673.1 DUF3795 domain-containing protein [Candidatus Sabulitectum sp.]HRW77620.1 DUF3795 domain-containing protein [Candidatus Sabulitectum sp.]
MEGRELRYDSYCGLNCGACMVGIANEMGKGDVLDGYAGNWKIPREKLECSGCKGDVTAGFCENCEMRLCAREKGIEFCFQCGEFPCKTITGFRNDDACHHSAVFSNLKKIREAGLEAWLASERKRWSCPECGERFGWYSERCSCGAELYDSVKEEKDLKC